MSVCVRVCLSVSALQPKRLGRFWWNFTQIVSRTWASVVFLRFWISQFDEVMAAILHFSRAALSRSQFWSDFVQNWTKCSLTVSRVCYWKSAKSVDNFRFYWEPRVRFFVFFSQNWRQNILSDKRNWIRFRQFIFIFNDLSQFFVLIKCRIDLRIFLEKIRFGRVEIRSNGALFAGARHARAGKNATW